MMKKLVGKIALAVVTVTIAMPALTFADPLPRLIPAGAVSLLADGKEVNRFTSEMPLPDGMLKVTEGNCIVRGEGVQFIAQNQTVFGVSETGQSWDATVESGRIDFAIRQEAKPITFHTPQGIARAERAVLPAGNDGVIRGYVLVRDNGAEITVLEGTLQVAAADESSLVEAGGSVLLAESGATRKKVAAASAGAAGVGAGAGLSSLGTGGMTAIGAGAAAVVGLAAAVAFTVNDDAESAKHDISPF